jgi:hypothetical protein
MPTCTVGSTNELPVGSRKSIIVATKPSRSRELLRGVKDYRAGHGSLDISAGCPRRRGHRLRRCRRQRSPLHRSARPRLLHAARRTAPALAVALGGRRGNLHPAQRAGRLFGDARQADPRPDLRIVPRRSPRYRRGLRRVTHARGARKPAAGKVSQNSSCH